MAHIAPHHGFFTAYFTYLGHDYSPLDVKKTNIKTISFTLNASGCKEFFKLEPSAKKYLLLQVLAYSGCHKYVPFARFPNRRKYSV